MRILFLTLAASCGASIFAVLSPDYSDWLLLTAPSALASAFLLIWKGLQRPTKPKNWAVVDGSNVMHWKGDKPDISTVRAVVNALIKAGMTPGVVFDANVGYKLSDRYMHNKELAGLLGLPVDQVMVVPKGVPADPYVLQIARDFDATIVTNDRFRDWAGDYPDVLDAKPPVRGGYKKGALWLSLET